jgi:hypothetical protein
MLSKDYQEAITQTLAIIDTDIDFKSKIPTKILDFLNNNASSVYQFSFDGNVSSSAIKKETKGLLAILYRNYICSQDEKQGFDELLKKNQEIYDKELHEKYNPDEVFNNDIKNDYTPIPEDNVLDEISLEDVSENVSSNIDLPNQESMLIVKEDNIFKRIFNKIKSLFIKEKP